MLFLRFNGRLFLEHHRSADKLGEYAEATHVSICIHVLNTLIKAEVKDNGKGRQKIKKGMGIIGMEERAASVNGKVIVDGSTLLCHHPAAQA